MVVYAGSRAVRSVFGEQSIWAGLTSWLLISCRDGYRWSSAARQGVVTKVEFDRHTCAFRRGGLGDARTFLLCEELHHERAFPMDDRHHGKNSSEKLMKSMIQVQSI